MTHAGSAHLVYVRRKSDADLGRSLPPSDHQSGGLLDCSQCGKTTDQEEPSQTNSLQLKESRICRIPKTSSLGFSSSGPMALPSLGNILVPANLNHLHSNSMPTTPNKLNTKHWEERSCELNNLLKKLDQSDQKDYLEMLRSLSSVELSKHAVELEKRSIQLSVEEAKELQRVQVLDVLERYSMHSSLPSTIQNM